MPEATSRRAKLALSTLVGGYLALAVLGGASNSPLTVLLPNGATAPTWASGLAKAAGVADLGRRGMTAVAWAVLLVVLAAFTIVLVEARWRRIRLAPVLVAAGLSLAIAVAAPLLLSRDVYTYAAYGRIFALHDRNPYVVPLSAFPHDPFVSVASVQWLHGHSHYGTLFTLVSAGIARVFAGSLDGTIFAFKLLAGVAIAIATGLTALTAAKIRPDRVAVAAALVGLNPVIVLHTVGGGHVDAVIAAPLAAAAAIFVANPRRRLAVTALLAGACLLKTIIFPVLALWLVYVRKGRLAIHIATIVALAVASSVMFFTSSHPFAPFASLGGIEAWASPSHFVGRLLGGTGRTAAEILFLVVYVALFARLSRRIRHGESPLEAWGTALLLLALCLPYLLPWYVAWFVPFLAFFEDTVLILAGICTSVVLALTLVPADPFHGLTTPAVMAGVHYVAAPLLLLVLLVSASRLRGRRRGRLVPLESTPGL